MLRTAALASVLALSATVAVARPERPKRPVAAQPAPESDEASKPEAEASTPAESCNSGEECRPTLRHDSLNR